MEDHASKIKGLIWVVVACALAIFFALGISPVVHAVPWSWEKKLAQSVDFAPAANICRAAPGADALLQRLVARLYPVEQDDNRFSIDVRVVKDPAVNAFAGLGGRISVNSGFLMQAESAEEVAGVLAHEISHVHHRDILQGFVIHLLTSQGLQTIFSSGDDTSSADWTNYFLSMSFSRSQEAAADEGGLARLQKAHIDNQGFKHFFERMEKSASAPAFLSDHPSDLSRSEMIEKFENRDVKPVMTRDEWLTLKHYCR